jgi:hypothetical protein
LKNGDIIAIGVRDKSYLVNNKTAIAEISVRYLEKDTKKDN